MVVCQPFDLQAQLQAVVQNPRLGRDTGQRARELIERRFSQGAVAAKVSQRLTRNHSSEILTLTLTLIKVIQRIKEITAVVKVTNAKKAQEEAAAEGARIAAENKAKEVKDKLENRHKKIKINDSGDGECMSPGPLLMVQ